MKFSNIKALKRERYAVHNCDNLVHLRTMQPCSVDSLVTDPPAGIAFMGKDWDTDKGGRDAWIAWMTEVMRECLRVLKPGAHGLVWALPRTSHWTAMALENAGFEVRDCITHLFGSGFPKSRDISLAIDKEAGVERTDVLGIRVPESNSPGGNAFGLNGHSLKELYEMREAGITKTKNGRSVEANIAKGEKSLADGPVLNKAPATAAAKQWQGWGTALKPASEHWWLVRKPFSEKTVAANVLKHGTGGINIDACRINTADDLNGGAYRGIRSTENQMFKGVDGTGKVFTTPAGRFPANLVLDEEAAAALDEQSGKSKSPATYVRSADGENANSYGKGMGEKAGKTSLNFGDSGGASRFFMIFSGPCGLKKTVAGGISAGKNAESKNDSLNTDGYGNSQMAPYHMGSISTISTETDLITSFQILNASSGLSIGICTLVTGKTIESFAASNIASVKLVSNIEALIYLGDVQAEPIRAIASIVLDKNSNCGGSETGNTTTPTTGNIVGSRFLYQSKASKSDKGAGNNHPTPKSTALMEYLVRLVTPPGGVVLDPFTGSGTTGKAALRLGMSFCGMEQSAEYAEIARSRCASYFTEDEWD